MVCCIVCSFDVVPDLTCLRIDWQVNLQEDLRWLPRYAAKRQPAALRRVFYTERVLGEPNLPGSGLPWMGFRTALDAPLCWRGGRYWSGPSLIDVCAMHAGGIERCRGHVHVQVRICCDLLCCSFAAAPC